MVLNSCGCYRKQNVLYYSDAISIATLRWDELKINNREKGMSHESTNRYYRFYRVDNII